MNTEKFPCGRWSGGRDQTKRMPRARTCIEHGGHPFGILANADNAVWSMNLLPRDKHVMPWRIEDEMKRLGFMRDSGASSPFGMEI